MNKDQTTAVIMGQGKLIMDYNVLLQEIFGEPGYTEGKSTDEILAEAIERVRLWKSSGDDIDVPTIISEMYGRNSNIHQYKLTIDEELAELQCMIESMECSDYLDIDDRYHNDPQMFIVEQCLVKRKVELERKKGGVPDDTERPEA